MKQFIIVFRRAKRKGVLIYDGLLNRWVAYEPNEFIYCFHNDFNDVVIYLKLSFVDKLKRFFL